MVLLERPRHDRRASGGSFFENRFGRHDCGDYNAPPGWPTKGRNRKSLDCNARCGVYCGVESTVMETVQIGLDAELLEAADRVTRRRRVNRSALGREALRAYL